jgi:hypothetical protein
MVVRGIKGILRIAWTLGKAQLLETSLALRKQPKNIIANILPLSMAGNFNFSTKKLEMVPLRGVFFSTKEFPGL